MRTRSSWLLLALVGTWVGGAGRLAADDQGPILFEAGTSSESSAPIADRNPLPRWRTPGAGEIVGQPLAPSTVGTPPHSSNTAAEIDVWQEPPATAPKLLDRKPPSEEALRRGAGNESEAADGALRRGSSPSRNDAAGDSEGKSTQRREPSKNPAARLDSLQKSLRERMSGRPDDHGAAEPNAASSDRGKRPATGDARSGTVDSSSRRSTQAATRGTTPGVSAYPRSSNPAVQANPAYRGQPAKQPIQQYRVPGTLPATGGNVQRPPAKTWPSTGQVPRGVR